MRGEAGKNETNQTNESVRKEGESQGNERKIEPRRGGGERPQLNSSRYIYIFWDNQCVYIYTEKRKIKTIERNILTRAREREGINSNFEGFPAYFCCWVIGK